METREENRNFPHKTEDSVLTGASDKLNNVCASDLVGTDTHTTRKGENDNRLDNLGNVPAKRVQFLEDERNRGKNSRGRKDPGVGHPPRN